MEVPLVIHTERESVVLRQVIPDDAPAIFEAVESSRDDLGAEFGNNTAELFTDLQKVEDSIAEIADSDELWLGIWDNDTFVGTIDLRPNQDDTAEIGYWISSRERGHGLSGVAIRALAKHVKSSYRKLYAEVATSHRASIKTLENSGFKLRSRSDDALFFELNFGT